MDDRHTGTVEETLSQRNKLFTLIILISWFVYILRILIRSVHLLGLREGREKRRQETLYRPVGGSPVLTPLVEGREVTRNFSRGDGRRVM